MKKNENVLVLDCPQALALIKKISEGCVIHPWSSSALDDHIKGCTKCAKKLDEITKEQEE